MDPFEHLNLPETPDLSGHVRLLGSRPIFTGPYSYVYRGKLRHNGEIVCSLRQWNAVHLIPMSGRNQGPQRRRRCRAPYHAKSTDYSTSMHRN
jgi:hypothetical protein